LFAGYKKQHGSHTTVAAAAATTTAAVLLLVAVIIVLIQKHVSSIPYIINKQHSFVYRTSDQYKGSSG
jgi:hypothetical protein